jgi:hypothetical protein
MPTPRTAYRFDDETRQKIRDIGRWLGGLDESSTLRVLVEEKHRKLPQSKVPTTEEKR